MDATDSKLERLLSEQPRMHIRELARKLKISRQAVHRRMQALVKSGVIKDATAGISVHYLDAVLVAVFGRCRTASMEQTMDKLAQSEFSRRAVVCGGNYLYVTGLLRNISELDGFTEFVRCAAEMQEPTVGIYSNNDGLMPRYSIDGESRRRGQFRELTPLDLRIIVSLKDNARRSVPDIAEMVGVTAKTVRRHLDGMISDGSLVLSVPMDLPSGGDMLLVTHITLKEGADKGKVGRRLLAKLHFEDSYIRTFSNLPGLLILVFWSNKMLQVRRTMRTIAEDEDVISVTPNFSYLERVYSTWRDKLPEAWRPPARKARVRGMTPGLRKKRSWPST